VNNARKHAAASQVVVRLNAESGSLRLTIEDDGRGFEVSSALRGSGRLGLLGMRDRARRLRGRFDVQSAVGKGTTVIVTIPLADSNRPIGKTLSDAIGRSVTRSESLPLATG